MTNQKSFVIQASDKASFETMPPEEVTKYLKEDGFDHLREKVYRPNMLESEFKTALMSVEKTIDKLKIKNDYQAVATRFNQPGKGPLEDRVIILPDEAAVMTDGGIFLATSNVPARGTVIAVGPGLPERTHSVLTGYLLDGQFKDILADGESGDPVYTLKAMPIKRGDRVLYSKQAGLKVEDPDTKKEFLVMRVTDVWITL